MKIFVWIIQKQVEGRLVEVPFSLLYYFYNLGCCCISCGCNYLFILTEQCQFSLGVIFRLQWSKDRSKLVSVSDDRTVRVWDVSIAGEGIQVTDILMI